MNYMGDRTCHQCSGNREDCWDEDDRASMRYDRDAKAWHARERGPQRSTDE